VLAPSNARVAISGSEPHRTAVNVDTTQGLLHNYTVARRLVRVLVLVPTLQPPPSSATAVTAIIVNVAVVKDSISIMQHGPIHDQGRVGHHWARSVRSGESMIMQRRRAAIRYHCARCHCRTTETAIGNHRAGSHRKRRKSTSQERCVAPLSWNSVVSPDVVTEHLVAAPWSLNHLQCFSIGEPSVTHWAGVWWCNQCLVGLTIGAAEKIAEETTWLAHREPRVAACW